MAHRSTPCYIDDPRGGKITVNLSQLTLVSCLKRKPIMNNATVTNLPPCYKSPVQLQISRPVTPEEAEKNRQHGAALTAAAAQRLEFNRRAAIVRETAARRAKPRPGFQ